MRLVTLIRAIPQLSFKLPPLLPMATCMLSNEFPTDAVKAALGASIETGAFVDTEYYLFSRRLSNGRVGDPQVIHANSVILKAAGEYFAARECRTLDSFQWVS